VKLGNEVVKLLGGVKRLRSYNAPKIRRKKGRHGALVEKTRIVEREPTQTGHKDKFQIKGKKD